MTQEFFTHTLISKYIKFLLSYTPLPLYPLIENGQHMIKGCRYIHKNKVLECFESGIYCAASEYRVHSQSLLASDELTVKDENEYPEFLTIIDSLTGVKKKSPLVVTDNLVMIHNYTLAKCDVIDYYDFGEYNNNFTKRFVSNVSYYDSKTHEMLGDYLRLIKNQFNVDLMSLYNCYNYKITENFSLFTSKPYAKDKTNKINKIMLVPIKFNKKYTVAIDSPTPLYIKAVIYKNGLVKGNDSEFITNKLEDRTLKLNTTQFSKPFVFELFNTDKYLQQFENCLYLAIQIPKNLNSTLTVLEGDFTDYKVERISDINIINESDSSVITNCISSIPSLLVTNDFKQHPFADKLIAYLLRNTIDDREYIDKNVSNIENIINYSPSYQGLWSPQLRYILHNRYVNSKYDLNKYDILGFVDRDIEDAIRKGYIKYVIE